VLTLGREQPLTPDNPNGEQNAWTSACLGELEQRLLHTEGRLTRLEEILDRVILLERQTYPTELAISVANQAIRALHTQRASILRHWDYAS
jgi:hypothetical protein